MKTIKIEGQEYDVSELQAAISKAGVKPVDARPIIKAGMLIGYVGKDKPWWYVTPEGKWSIIGQRAYADGVDGIGARLKGIFKVFEWPATPILSLDEAAVRANYGFQVGDVVSLKGEGEFQYKHSGRGIVDDLYVGHKYPYRVELLGARRNDGDDFDWFRHDQLTLIEPAQGLPQ
jgi:hypothetical protein